MTHSGMERKKEDALEKISLADFLAAHHYRQSSLRKLVTGHLVTEVFINDVPGLFILDSGAGATVVDEKWIELFRLRAIVDTVTGAGAGGTGLTVYSSFDNRISISEFYISPFKIAAMNL